MPLEDDIEKRRSEKASASAAQSKSMSEIRGLLVEFHDLMIRNRVEPEALYAVSFVRQVEKGRPYGRWRSPKAGIDVYHAEPIQDVWFCGTDYRDWAGPDTGTAFTPDGLAIRWTTDYKPVRSTTGGIGGGGLSIEARFDGLRECGRPRYLSGPAVPVGSVFVPVGPAFPDVRDARAKLADLADFYLGRSEQRPSWSSWT